MDTITPDWFWFCFPFVVLVLRAAASTYPSNLLPQHLHNIIVDLLKSLQPNTTTAQIRG
jgi:hypothetical protein